MAEELAMPKLRRTGHFKLFAILGVLSLSSVVGLSNISLGAR